MKHLSTFFSVLVLRLGATKNMVHGGYFSCLLWHSIPLQVFRATVCLLTGLSQVALLHIVWPWSLEVVFS